jgi:hypothetical protein
MLKGEPSWEEAGRKELKSEGRMGIVHVKTEEGQ